MNHTTFEEPVAVVVGLGFVKHINTAMDAYTFLNEWPVHHTKSAYALALKVCRAAISGDADGETARTAFLEFARSNHLLAPTLKPVELPKVSADTTLAA